MFLTKGYILIKHGNVLIAEVSLKYEYWADFYCFICDYIGTLHTYAEYHGNRVFSWSDFINMDNEMMVGILRIGDKAPDFSAKTTFGDIKMSDLAGRWVVMFSHPGDFTPVCTTEFMAIAMYYPYFIQRNVQLMGLSIDSLHAHLGWLYNIYKSTGIEIPFPIIADRDMKVARLYGMISPAVSETSTVRSVYIIDDKQVIRAVLQYPQTTGRYIPEIIRIIDSLQTVDKDKVVTPADWLPGMPVVVPPPVTYKELKERVQNTQGYTSVDWYLSTKPDVRTTAKPAQKPVTEKPKK